MSQQNVLRRGTDSSGRVIYASNYLWQVWQAFLADDRIAPISHKIVVVQGPWMSKNGGGAEASAGYHDKGGCIDIRTWNLTTSELDLVVLVASRYAIHFWRRDRSREHGGMDPHAHAICGWDFDLASGAVSQWAALKCGRDGLASDGPDYERRVKPLVLIPPKVQEDYMASDAAEKKLDTILDELRALAKNERRRAVDTKDRDADAVVRDENSERRATQRFQRIVSDLGALVDSLEESNPARGKILTLLSDNPDVNGVDNPQEA